MTVALYRKLASDSERIEVFQLGSGFESRLQYEAIHRIVRHAKKNSESIAIK